MNKHTLSGGLPGCAGAPYPNPPTAPAPIGTPSLAVLWLVV